MCIRTHTSDLVIFVAQRPYHNTLLPRPKINVIGCYGAVIGMGNHPAQPTQNDRLYKMVATYYFILVYGLVVGYGYIL